MLPEAVGGLEDLPGVDVRAADRPRLQGRPEPLGGAVVEARGGGSTVAARTGRVPWRGLRASGSGSGAGPSVYHRRRDPRPPDPVPDHVRSPASVPTRLAARSRASGGIEASGIRSGTFGPPGDGPGVDFARRFCTANGDTDRGRDITVRLKMDCRVVPTIGRSGHPTASCHGPGRCERTRRTPGTAAGSPGGSPGGGGARNAAATRTLRAC